MQQSESIANLAAALVKVQAKLQHPKKSNPKSRFGAFANINDVIDTNRAALAEHGLAVIQTSFGDNGAVGVTTRLVHESGEWVEDSCAIALVQENKANCLAQVAGSNITYLRRYGWQSILGLNGENDDDGAGLMPESGGGSANSTPRDVDDLLG